MFLPPASNLDAGHRHDGSVADQLTSHGALHSSVESSAGPLAALIGSPVGDTANTPVVLMVPGYTGSKEDFAPILDPLVEAGLVAIAIDQPGQNESPGSTEESDYSPAALGEVIASVIGKLAFDHQVVLLGHSFGGLVSRAAVISGAPVSGLILLCSGPAAFAAGDRFEALTRGEVILREHGQAIMYDGARQAGGLDPDAPDPVARFLRRRFIASSRAGLLGMGQALLTEPDRTGELAATLSAAGIPAAVIAGEADDAWPLPDQSRMARTLGTELVLVPGGAHSPAAEAPENLMTIMLPLLRGWVGPH